MHNLESLCAPENGPLAAVRSQRNQLDRALKRHAEECLSVREQLAADEAILAAGLAKLAEFDAWLELQDRPKAMSAAERYLAGDPNKASRTSDEAQP